jgi:hypothetical protein
MPRRCSRRREWGKFSSFPRARACRPRRRALVFLRGERLRRRLRGPACTQECPDCVQQRRSAAQLLVVRERSHSRDDHRRASLCDAEEEDREERFVAVLVALHDTLVAKRARAGHVPDPHLVMKAMLDRAATLSRGPPSASSRRRRPSSPRARERGHESEQPRELDFAHSSSSSTLSTLGPATLIIEGLGSAWAPELDGGPPAQNSLFAASMMALSSLATSMAPISSSP